MSVVTRLSLVAARLSGIAAIALVAGSSCDSGRETRSAASDELPGGTIAFSADRNGEDNFADVFVVPSHGRGKKQLTRREGPEFDPSWSPDGTHIVYRDSRRGINENDEIYVMDRDGSNRRNLSRATANDWSPAWSRDGALIAFASQRNGLSIWTMRPDGSKQRQVSAGPSDEYPTWSPDSKEIAFMRGGDIWVVRADGSDEHSLVTSVDADGWPAWSPDGERIGFVIGYEGSRRLALVKRNGKGLRELTHGQHDDMGVSWSPDGTHLVFSRDGELMTMRADGSALRDLGVTGSLPEWTAG